MDSIDGLSVHALTLSKLSFFLKSIGILKDTKYMKPTEIFIMAFLVTDMSLLNVSVSSLYQEGQLLPNNFFPGPLDPQLVVWSLG